jgi:hypothetical protein
MGPTSAVAIRATLFRAVGGFDPNLHALQDYDLWLRLCLRAPVVYDGGHNLRFSAVSNLPNRISIDVSRYRSAFSLLRKKYERELSRLSFIERRKFFAQTKLLLAGKNLQQSSYVAASVLLLQALSIYPPTLGRLIESWLDRTLRVTDSASSSSPKAKGKA